MRFCTSVDVISTPEHAIPSTVRDAVCLPADLAA
jgi:hypothetical protein